MAVRAMTGGMTARSGPRAKNRWVLEVWGERRIAAVTPAPQFAAVSTDWRCKAASPAPRQSTDRSAMRRATDWGGDGDARLA